MHKLIAKIKALQLPCYFVSPHFDDAALSAGSLMAYLSNKTQVTVINVFTKAESGPKTLSANHLVHLTGYASADSMYKVRQLEDSEALSHLRLSVVNLGFTDALWRLKTNPTIMSRFLGRLMPEFLHLYPSYRLHVLSSRPVAQDKSLITNLSTSLHQIIDPSQAVVFCPVGIGGHVDHTVVRLAVAEKFKPVYWQDQPYSALTKATPPGVDLSAMTSFEFAHRLRSKKRVLNRYKSQINLLFPHGKIPFLKEKYFYAN